ncbi:hypothetical protein, partial [Escherichia coli]|uniref:hypothetical protein n=1 Tax=Escherichia coli TaxID=562 RepID=UPI001BC86270
ERETTGVVGKAERLTWHKAWTMVSTGFSISYTLNLTQQMLLKSRFLEFTNISAQLANIKEQRLSKVTFMIG